MEACNQRNAKQASELLREDSEQPIQHAREKRASQGEKSEPTKKSKQPIKRELSRSAQSLEKRRRKGRGATNDGQMDGWRASIELRAGISRHFKLSCADAFALSDVGI